ncbi:S-glutathione dehydrogenase [Basidiobolus meristosporus CBS 931.73]|uniref:S-glutathione dehydrogenase n=1 Tax=Basidiobolus meristosporus CBS 931.73 TaxID=1314790 RepID=A0A1Y1Z4Q9_9FUNG|nr:S-glutathione dehydrogenase [Basidiobolus meristosporus CBS 931.73]|eukprot:ORY05240.1 S-glutathione dehydrogenase [Basidiobolus meristosporus CBS 931.73]
MEAVTFIQDFEILTKVVPRPTLLEPTDVIVQVHLAGLCGSDLHVYRGDEVGCAPHRILGHEFMGRIVEVGGEVSAFEVNDRVSSAFTTSCGECFYCLKGLTCRCEKSQLFGWHIDGAQAEYVRVPLASTTLLKLPEIVSDEEGLLIGDVFPTGFYCARNGLSGIKPEDMADTAVAVIGCGPVGLMSIIGAKELGATKIYAIDSVPERLGIARSLGADAVSSENDPIEFLKGKTAGRGVDVVLEAVGNTSALDTAFNIMRPGGIISSIGVHNSADFPFSPAEGYNRNVTYISGRCPARAMMDKLIPILEKKKYNISQIISHRFPLREANQAYHLFDKKLDNCTKVVFVPIDLPRK